MMTNETTLQHSPVHLLINWSWILLIQKIFFLQDCTRIQQFWKSYWWEKKGNFPLYPRQKLILLPFLLVKYHVIYGLSLVRRVGLVWEQSNIMIRIYLFFRLGDLLLKLLMPSFNRPKSILLTRVPTIGSVRFLLLSVRRWVLHWFLCGILMIFLLNGNPLQLRQVSTSRPAYMVDWIQDLPLRSMDPSKTFLLSRYPSFRLTPPAWISLLVSLRVSSRSIPTWG